MVANKAVVEIATRATNSAKDQSMLWGSPIEFWDLWGVRLLFIGALIGVGGLVLSALSAYVLYRVADVSQKDLASETSRATTELGKAKAEIAKANEKTAALELERLRMLKELEWRHLSAEQAVEIGAVLKEAFPTRLVIVSLDTDREF